jgi:hypothetical protein
MKNYSYIARLHRFLLLTKALPHMSMFQREGIRKGGLPPPLASQYLFDSYDIEELVIQIWL